MQLLSMTSLLGLLLLPFLPARLMRSSAMRFCAEALLVVSTPVQDLAVSRVQGLCPELMGGCGASAWWGRMWTATLSGGRAQAAEPARER